MTDRYLLNLTLASILVTVLAACGGASGAGVVSTPPSSSSPPLSTSGPPTPPPPSSVPASTALIAPVQSTAPGVIEATVGGPRIGSDAAMGMTFPVTQTAVAGNFGGDAIDTSRSKGFYPNLIGDGPFLTYAGGGWNLGAVVAPLNDLDWTTYGYWNPFPYSAIPHTSRGAWVAGFQTPFAAIPIAGSGQYSGKVLGLHGNSSGSISGDVNLQADFSTRTLAGNMTNLVVQAAGIATGAMNDVIFTATVSPGLNQFTGTTHAGAAPASPWALSTGASGDLTGHFFGPAAQEVGAVWTLADGQTRAIGSFGAKRD
jgi:hypothetical protein